MAWNFNPFRVALFLVAGTVAAMAHDIPTDLTARIFVKPEQQRLVVLMRIPLSAVRDVQLPLQEGGFLDVERTYPDLPALARFWMAQSLEVYENGSRLPEPSVVHTNLAFSFDRAFSDFRAAASRVSGNRLTNDAKVVAEQLWFDARLEVPVRSSSSAFSIRAGTERLAARVTTVVRFLPPGGNERVFQLHAEGPDGDTAILHLDPSWQQATLRFTRLGFEHILEGADHLLFLLCLVIPLRQPRSLFLAITAFTAAHSVTLIASAFGYTPDALWFPPLIETLIALSILCMALENIIGASASGPVNPLNSSGAAALGSRWLLAFCFGLVHGFGFAFLLRESLQFAGAHVVSSLLAFNVGVELGQIVVLLVTLPMLHLAFRFVVPERIGAILLSAIVAHTAWHWMEERATTLAAYDLLIAEGMLIPLLLLLLLAVLSAGAIARAALFRRTDQPAEP